MKPVEVVYDPALGFLFVSLGVFIVAGIIGLAARAVHVIRRELRERREFAAETRANRIPR